MLGGIVSPHHGPPGGFVHILRLPEAIWRRGTPPASSPMEDSQLSQHKEPPVTRLASASCYTELDLADGRIASSGFGEFAVHVQEADVSDCFYNFLIDDMSDWFAVDEEPMTAAAWQVAGVDLGLVYEDGRWEVRDGACHEHGLVVGAVLRERGGRACSGSFPWSSSPWRVRAQGAAAARMLATRHAAHRDLLGQRHGSRRHLRGRRPSCLCSGRRTTRSRGWRRWASCLICSLGASSTSRGGCGGPC